MEECRVLVLSSNGEREEVQEAKSEQFTLIPGAILGWDGVEWKTQASCASPSSFPVGIILFTRCFLAINIFLAIYLPELACFSHILIQDFWKSEKERNDPLLNTNGLVRVEGGAEAVTRGHLRLAGTV